MTKRVLARAAALTGAAAIAAGILVGIAAPAQAASLGTVALSQPGGNVNDTPMFASGTSSAPCPSGYGENVGLRIGQPGGPYVNLARSLGGGGYELAPVTIAANRSFTTALGGTAPAEGEWWVIIDCYSLTAGRHVDEFVTPITVVGDAWVVKQETSTTLDISPASPVKRGTLMKLTATVSPAEAAGSVEFKRGTTLIGTAEVEAGTAKLYAIAWTVGTHEVTATFVPADPAAFVGSGSAPILYTITKR
jgi:hypothetical protein